MIINPTRLFLVGRLLTVFAASYVFALQVPAVEPDTRPLIPSSISQAHLVLSAPIGGFDKPVFATGAGDGSNRLFVVDQVGRIHIVKNGAVLSTPFLDITSRVRYPDGFGLMSLAFPPGYAGKGYFYVYYMNLSGNPEIARFRITANADVADANSQQVVLTVTEQVGGGHVGGHIAFSPRDGYLYLGVGDGEPGEAGSEGDPLNRAQDPAQLRGKMLRLDVESGKPATYTIPASNPFVNHAGYRPEIWAVGLRNPWRFSFDRQTGDLYIGDNGQDLYEEVDFQPASSAGGENYGWRIMEGNHCYVPSSGCSTAGLTLPILEFAHTSSCASVIGGFVYRGSSYAGLQGTYLYLDYCDGKVSGLIRENNVWQNTVLLETNLPYTFASFGEDEQGDIYVLGTFNGSIYKIQDACSFTLASTGASLSAAAGTGNVNFTAAASDCGWTASSNASFITITSSASGTGNGTVSYSVALNTGSLARSGTLTIGGQTFTVNQSPPQWEGAVLPEGQSDIRTWIYLGRTYAYLKLSFPNAGYRVTNWGQAAKVGNAFTADALVERFTGASVQAVSTTALIYDLGPLPDGNYTFTFKNSGAVVKSQAFTVSSVIPPPNPIDNAREFVKQQYRDFLNREADPAGEDFWTDNITKCMDPARRPVGQTEAQCTTRQRETTCGAFFQSPEFQYTGYYVYRMYQGAFGRRPKLSEFIPDAQFVGDGIIVNGQLSGAQINQNKAAFAAQFVNCVDATKYRCAEFKAIYDPLTNQQFVEKLFQTTGVNASAADRAALVNGLSANPATETRASVVQKVVDGINVISEGNQQFTTTYGQRSTTRNSTGRLYSWNTSVT